MPARVRRGARQPRNEGGGRRYPLDEPHALPL